MIVGIVFAVVGSVGVVVLSGVLAVYLLKKRKNTALHEPLINNPDDEYKLVNDD